MITSDDHRIEDSKQDICVFDQAVVGAAESKRRRDQSVIEDTPEDNGSNASSMDLADRAGTLDQFG